MSSPQPVDVTEECKLIVRCVRDAGRSAFTLLHVADALRGSRQQRLQQLQRSPAHGRCVLPLGEREGGGGEEREEGKRGRERERNGKGSKERGREKAKEEGKEERGRKKRGRRRKRGREGKEGREAEEESAREGKEEREGEIERERLFFCTIQ